MSTPAGRLLVSLSPRLLVCLSLLATGCDLFWRPNPADRPVAAEQVTAFASLYRLNCAGCHGAEGKFGPAPPLNELLFRAIVPEKELEIVISKGRMGTPMPAFAKENGGSLTAAQIQVLVNEIKGLPYRIVEHREGEETKLEVVREATGIMPKWGGAGHSFEDVPSYLASDAKAGGAGKEEQGARVFERACEHCHGTNGKGGHAHEGHPLLKINDAAFLSLISEQALRRFVITGRQDLGMPSYREKTERPADFERLTSEEVADVVALLKSWKAGSGNGR